MKQLTGQIFDVSTPFGSQGSVLAFLAVAFLAAVALYIAVRALPKRYVASLYAKEGDGHRTQLWSGSFRFRFSAVIALHKKRAFCDSLGCSYSQYPIEFNISRVDRSHIPLAA